MPKHLLAALLALCAVLASPVASLAQPSEAGGSAAPADPPGAEQPAEPSAASVEEPSAQPSAAPATERGTDLAAELAAARKALEHYRSRTGPEKQIALFGLLASVTWFLIGLVRRFNDAWPKTWLPKIAAGLGVIAGGSTYLFGGASWPEALLYGAGPPLAVFLHELLKKPKKAADGGPKPGWA